MEEPPQEGAYHLAGDRLGKFVILSELGRGSMGVVYEAFQEDLKQKIAIKILPANITLDAKHVKRFRREAESIARLRHDNIIRIFEVGEIDRTHYFAMELIQGTVFGKGAGKDKDSIVESARLVMQAARGLAHAHGRGVIHRDIKPGNLLVDAEGRVVVTDFGLARLSDSASLTSTDAIVGTPKYMSPEQILPGPKPIDGRTDVYSLGAALYEVITGRPPFDEPSVQAFIKAIMEDRPASPRRHNRQVPHDLATIILRCLEKDPGDRYASAADLADDLERFLAGERIHAKPKGSLALAYEVVRRHKVISALSLAVAVALIVSLALAGRAAKATETGRISRQLTAILNNPDLDMAVEQVKDLAARHPGNAEVQRTRHDTYRKWAERELEAPEPDHAEVLRHLEVAELQDDFWALMCLLETHEFERAEGAAARLPEGDPLRGLLLARLAIERGAHRQALETLGPEPATASPQLRIYRALVTARAFMAEAREMLAQGSRPNHNAKLNEAQLVLAKAREQAAGIHQRWLRTRINTLLTDVKTELGDVVDWKEIILDTVAFAGEGLNLLTRFWAAMSRREVEIAKAYTRRVLQLANEESMPRAALRQKAEQRVRLAADNIEKATSNLLLAVALLSLGQPDEARDALFDAEDAFHPPLVPYIQWGQSLAYRAQDDIGQAMELSTYAIDSALGLKNRFLDIKELFQYAILLAEEARRQGAAPPLVRTKAEFIQEKLESEELSGESWTSDLLARVRSLASP